MPREKTVLIIGGGVAALAAAVALVEANRKSNPITFKIHIITQAHRWGGKASSWGGGMAGPHVDLGMWPPTFALNHGFHLIFDESYYRNFWYTLREAWNNSSVPPPRSLEDLLYSNRHETLVHQRVYDRNVICRLQATPGLLIPGSHLRGYVSELRRKGGWSPKELASIQDVIFREVFRYPTFRRLLEIDEKQDPCTKKKYPNIDFRQWCLARGLEQSVIDNAFFKFVYDASFVSPFDMEAAAALKTCWGVIRNFKATRWYYVQGGYSQDLFNPVHHYLHEHEDFSCTMLEELRSFSTAGSRITGYESRQVADHPDSSQPRKQPSAETLAKYKALEESGKLAGIVHHVRDEFDCTKPPKAVDYFISTLPLDNLWEVLTASGMTKAFPNIARLHGGHPNPKVPRTVATVNLQAWFQRRVTDPSFQNFIAGLSPLPVMVDYKNFLPMYQDNVRWPGSVLELNGSVEELRKSIFTDDVEQFLDIPQSPIQPTAEARISFAKRILLHIADKYGFPELKSAVQEEAFLEVGDWQGRTRWRDTNKIPPFLWWNVHENNSYFVTSPGTLYDRPRTRTPYDNLFLAGDWIRNGIDLPCMEGAARSGRMAALEILKAERCPELIDIYDPE
ncbi:MAG: NAD(P)-binding protein [Nitrospira sp.]